MFLPVIETIDKNNMIIMDATTTSTQVNFKLTKIGPSFINKYSNNISSI
jgi:hypothetical protein